MHDAFTNPSKMDRHADDVFVVAQHIPAHMTPGPIHASICALIPWSRCRRITTRPRATTSTGMIQTLTRARRTPSTSQSSLGDVTGCLAPRIQTIVRTQPMSTGKKTPSCTIDSKIPLRTPPIPHYTDTSSACCVERGFVDTEHAVPARWRRPRTTSA